MPSGFKIGAIVAVLSLILSIFGTLQQRIILTFISLLISFIACLFFCRFQTVTWQYIHLPCTITVYFLISYILLKLYIWCAIKKILVQEFKLYNSEYKVVQIDPAEFTHCNFNSYNQAENELKSIGFKKLDDVEFVHITQNFPEIRFFTRLLLNDKKNTIASIQQIEYTKNHNENCCENCYIKFDTKFSDGKFLVTTNDTYQNNNNKNISSDLKTNNPLTKLWLSHQADIDRICNENNIDTIFYNTLGDFIESNKNTFIEMSKSWKQNGGLTKMNLEKFIENKNNSQISNFILRMMYKEYFRQLKNIVTVQ
ncbi:MAG: hypothetical protein LBE18_05875 [Planctomycetaceae bacterium]|nr:hypothetical protein [Planctomycetaceae bacterium]